MMGSDGWLVTSERFLARRGRRRTPSEEGSSRSGKEINVMVVVPLWWMICVERPSGGVTNALNIN